MDYSDKEDNSDGESIDDLLGSEDLFNDEADEDDNDTQADQEKIKDQDEVEEKESKEKVEKKIRQPRIVKNPRVTLKVDSLQGKNGLSALKKLFSNFKFKGNGHEKEDLTKIMGILQQWMCYQLCPSYDFESCLLQLESLGKKKVVQTLMKKYRLGMDDWGEKKHDDEDDEDNPRAITAMEVSENIGRTNEFDKLLNEEITNAESEGELEDIIMMQSAPPEPVITTQSAPPEPVITTPNAPPEPEFALTQEQLERIARNRKLAEERRLKRMSAHRELMQVTESGEKSSEQDISIEKINLEDNS